MTADRRHRKVQYAVITALDTGHNHHALPAGTTRVASGFGSTCPSLLVATGGRMPGQFRADSQAIPNGPDA